MKHDSYFLKLLAEKVYYCTTAGEVFKTSSNKLYTTKDDSGYIRIGYVVSTKPYKKISIRAHRLVWLYFNGEIPPGLVVNHKNGNKSDNRLENLELLSIKDNNRHALGLSKTGITGKPFNILEPGIIDNALEAALLRGDYWCDKLGSVYSKAKGRALIPSTAQGYKVVYLKLGLPGKGNNLKVHRVVWTFFNGKIPTKAVINHKNGDRSDNRLENLECVSHSENITHAYRKLGSMNMRGEKGPTALLTNLQVLKIREDYVKGVDRNCIMEQYNIKPCHFNEIVSYRVYKEVGEQWELLCKEKLRKGRIAVPRFTDEQILEIFETRKRKNIGYRKLATIFNVDPSIITRIINRQSYKHVDIPPELLAR